MELLRPLFWGQGMLLQPQHFQQQDHYHEGRLHRYFWLFSPFSWGVHRLRLNEAGLQNFVFEIENCETLTFDGSLLRFGAEANPATARIAPRSFEHDLDPSGKPLAVYLGVRRLQAGESNVSSLNGAGSNGVQDGAAVRRRFLLEESEVPDVSVGSDHTCQVQYLIHDTQILFDVAAERAQNYELVKLAEINRSPDGKGGVLSKQYIPPSITIKSSAVLETMLKEMRDLLTAKARELGTYSHRGGKDSPELGARDLGYLLMVQMLNRYVPQFHHHLETGHDHPEVLYLLLRQLVGELSTFSQTTSVLGERGDDALPAYQHTDLWPCFSLATERARDLLNELTTAPVGDILLKHDGEFFAAALDQHFLTGDNRYYLAIRCDLSAAQLYKLLQDTGKITSRADMPNLQKSFLFGLTLGVLESPPEELRMRAHYRYFLVDQRSPHWQRIAQQRNIAVYSSALPPDTEMRLLAIWGE